MSAADFALKTQEQLIIKTDGREVMKDGERAAIIVPFQAQIDAPKKQIASAPSSGQTLLSLVVVQQLSLRKIESIRTGRCVSYYLSYEGKTAFQADKLMDPYKGMWIETDGKIVGLYPDGQGAAIAALRNENDPIECRFSADHSRVLGRYNSGEGLKVRGKISSTQNGQQLYLIYCELAS